MEATGKGEHLDSSSGSSSSEDEAIIQAQSDKKPAHDDSSDSEKEERRPRNRDRSSSHSSRADWDAKRRDRSNSLDRDHRDSRDNRRGGYNDYRDRPRRDFGRRYSNDGMFKPKLNGPLLSFKQFMERQEQSIEIEKAEKCYEEYKEEHDKKQCDIFFAEHYKTEPWFKEKYHPSLVYTIKKQKMEVAKKQSELFCKSVETVLAEFTLFDETALTQGFNLNSNTVYLGLVPSSVSRL